MPGKDEGALSDIRVLDLAGEIGVYCTKLLADLGADVIRIEPPWGDPMRSRGPFYHDEPHPEKSLYFFTFNTNKRSITLNLETSEGCTLLKRLVERTDIVVETFTPGYLEEKGLGYAALSQINPGLILTSITPFGQTGPYRHYKGPDIVGQAMGGLLYVCGWEDLPPVQMGACQAYYLASVQAAVGTLIALHHRDLTGRGQHVDVSMQQAVPVSLTTSLPVYELTGEIRRRVGDEHRGPAWGVFPCKDGFVDCRLRAHRWRNFVGWLDSEGMAGDLKEEKWQDAELRQREVEHIDTIFRNFLMQLTREELCESGQVRRIEVMPVNTTAEILEDPHLAARGFFVDVEHPELGASLRYPGPPYRLSHTPWRMTRRAPLLGEDNLAIYEELGLTREELLILKEAGGDVVG